MGGDIDVPGMFVPVSLEKLLAGRLGGWEGVELEVGNWKLEAERISF